MMAEKKWFVYILRCSDGTLYTGMTDDVARRVKVHNSGKGAKYTRGRTPVEAVYSEECESYSAALKRECAIKRLTRQEKMALIAECTKINVFFGINIPIDFYGIL